MEKESLLMNNTSSNSLNYTALSLPQPNWQSSSAMEAQLGDINCCPEQFFNLNWGSSIDQTTPFESALSSIVSSPSAASNSAVAADSSSIRELIGRLGSICNNGEVSPTAMAATTFGAGNTISANASRYSTPMNSPPKLNLSSMDQQIVGIGNSMGTSFSPPFPADPGFAERAAKFSCFDGKNFGGLNCQFTSQETQLKYGIPSNQSLKFGSEMGVGVNKEIQAQNEAEAEMRSVSACGSASERKLSKFSRSSTPDDEETSVTNHSLKSPNDPNSRKRKAAPKGKSKEVPLNTSVKDSREADDVDSTGKKSKTADAGKTGTVKTEQKQSPSSGNGGKNQGKDSSKPLEPPKDYIHVRAKRGQATDSHSLAERVRREKISERMKFLQDLVPGCNKVTGKAVMLDEIINYVQSLQRQVEFLSMKLATVNPRLDINMDDFPKDVLQSRGSLPQPIYSMNSLSSMFPYGHQSQQGALQSIVSRGLETMNPLDATLQRTLSSQLPAIDVHGNASSQLASFWEEDLQNVVQMGFTQNLDMVLPSQNFQGSLSTAHMKVEQ